jgi:hypothetical protein
MFNWDGCLNVQQRPRKSSFSITLKVRPNWFFGEHWDSFSIIEHKLRTKYVCKRNIIVIVMLLAHMYTTLSRKCFWNINFSLEATAT